MIKEKNKIMCKEENNLDDEILVVKENNEVIGFMEIKLSQNFFNRGEKEYIIEDVYIERKFRFKGYGKKLMNILYDLAIRNNISTIIAKNVENISFQNYLYSMGFGQIINKTFIHTL